MAKWIKTNGLIENVKPANGTDFSLEELQGFVNGYVEIVRFPNKHDLIMIVDDEGALKDDKAINWQASSVVGQFIFGNVLICKNEEVK